MISALTQSELFALLSTGQTVVVPHAHTAQTLRGRFQTHLKDAESSPADHSSPLAWTQWTSSLWSNLVLEGHEDRLLLNSLQEQHLWTGIIAARRPAREAPADSADELANLAQSALRLAAAYNIVDRLRPAADTVDTQTFAMWLDTFTAACNRQRLLSPALLDQALVRHLRSGALQTASPVHLVGFEFHTPSQRDLLTALQSIGIDVHTHSVTHRTGASQPSLAVTARNPREELRLAVRLIAHQARAETASTFALVLPEPQNRRPELERLLREILAPELEPITADLSSTPWHFSRQPPLNTSLLIKHALHLLRWLIEPLSIDPIGHLLLSPYLGFTDSLETRSHFEAKILRDGRLLRPELTLSAFLHLASRSAHTHAKFPELHSLKRQIDREKLLGGSRTFADWADQVRTLLRTAAWPGPRILSPAEFAATEAWESLLDLLSTLTATSARRPFAGFLAQLEREAAQTSLPSPTSNSPLQVLTLPETEGLAFDHTLLLSATDTNLPAAERLHPLLPRDLQLTFQVPGSDPAQTYTRTRIRLERLAQRSGSLKLFAPKADETGPLRFTPLIHDLRCVSASPETLLRPSPEVEPIELAEILDTAPLPPLPSPQIGGGARVLELQAACGFRAFATLRLNAGEIPSATLGLDAREAGSRLHKALELLWRNLQTQSHLRALSTSERQAAVHSAVSFALQTLQSTSSAEDPWSQAFLDILQHRFTRLLLRWLDCELDRSPFEIHALEQERVTQIGPLELKLRVDRIDRVDDADSPEAGQIFVDYKTAYTLSTDDWLGERPDAPQLPLYALLANPEQLRGLAFARVRWDENIGWISLSDSPGLLPQNAKNRQHDLPTELGNWRSELTRLAQAFADGQTDVAPKTYPDTCQFCAHRLLCRLDPTELLAQRTEEDPAEDDLLG